MGMFVKVLARLAVVAAGAALGYYIGARKVTDSIDEALNETTEEGEPIIDVEISEEESNAKKTLKKVGNKLKSWTVSIIGVFSSAIDWLIENPKESLILLFGSGVTAKGLVGSWRTRRNEVRESHKIYDYHAHRWVALRRPLRNWEENELYRRMNQGESMYSILEGYGVLA